MDFSFTKSDGEGLPPRPSHPPTRSSANNHATARINAIAKRKDPSPRQSEDAKAVLHRDPGFLWQMHFEAFKAFVCGNTLPDDPATARNIEIAQYHLQCMRELSLTLVTAGGKDARKRGWKGKAIDTSPILFSSNAQADVPEAPNHLSASTEDSINISSTKHESDSDVLRTDSGYCSAEQANRQPLVPGAVNGPGSTNAAQRDEEAMTLLSAATEDLPDAARHAISEICATISRQIREQVREADRNSFYGVLPGIIKSFAIRFGLDKSHPLSRTIMFFVYARHREIAAILRSLIFDDEDDDESERSKARQVQGMSVRDKLAILWGNRPQEGAIEAEPPELFVGVVGTEDEEEHGAIITEPEVSVYTQTILGSQPYQWLIGSLLRESTFHWDETEPRVMVDGVRQTIVAELHTGIISPRREPDSHKVTFQITWSALKHRLQYERSFRGRTANGLRDVLSGSIALTSSSSHEIQATTVEQYLIQTWGPSGAEILRVLSEILPDPELTAPNLGVVDATSPGGPAGIRAEINERRDAVLVSVTGPACLVGERAEQLAWLVATLQCSPAHEWRSIHAKTSLLKMPSSGEGDTRWLLAPNNETEAHERALSLLSGWLGQLVCRVIARGFPTTRRPKLCPGIEIPAPMLQSFLKLAGMERTSTLNIGTIASGPSGTLKLVKREGRLFVWHMFQLRVSDACSCHEILRRATDPEDSTTWLSDGDMSQTRHILGDCESTRAWLAGMPPLEPPTSPRPTSTTWRESPSNTDAMSDASSTMRTAIHWKNEEGEREKKLFSPSAESSHETSIDSDMLSISATSTSSWTSLINEHEELSAVIAFVARRLYSEYRNTRFRTGATQDTNKRAHVCRSQSTIRGNTELSCLEHCFSRLRISDASEPRLEDCVKGNPSLVGEPQHGQPEAPSDSPGGSGTSSGSSGGAPLLPRATQQGKGKGRQTVGNGGDGDKDQDSYKPLSKKRARRERPDTTARVLACHFWKNDPEKHRCCFKSELNTVSRVKQHLWRKHTPEYYCERCKVILSDEQTHTLHLEQTPVCELNQDATLDGITHQQQRKLSRRSKKTLDESEQWFVIWDDLFPRQGRPSSPYMDADLSEDVYRYRRYVQRTGHEVLTEELRRRGILLSLQQEDTDADMAVREKAVREALRISLDLMLSDWLSSRSAGEASSASSELREPLPCPKRQKRPRSPRPPTPSDSFADSGIGMLNNPLVRDQRQNRNSNQKGNTECSEGEYLAESGEVQPPRRLDGENLAASSFSAGFFPDSFFDQDGLLDAPVEYNGVVDPAMVPSEGGQLPQSDPLDMGFLGFHSGADVDDSGNDPWS